MSNTTSTTSHLSEPTILDAERTVQRGLEALRNAPLNASITDALKFLVPSGYRPIAQFEEDGRKKRNTAGVSNWNPETGEIVIYFERDTSAQPAGASSVEAGSAPSKAHEPLAIDVASGATAPRRAQTISQIRPGSFAVTARELEECCAALSEAEKKGRAFISLTWFRDKALPSSGYVWVDSAESRQAVLTRAIEEDAIVTGTIPNPKPPYIATTTIRLNRESTHAARISPRFQPVVPRGNMTASDIVIQDRGRF